jgi:hypothetical protein
MLRIKKTVIINGLKEINILSLAEFYLYKRVIVG